MQNVICSTEELRFHTFQQYLTLFLCHVISNLWIDGKYFRPHLLSLYSLWI